MSLKALGTDDSACGTDRLRIFRGIRVPAAKRHHPGDQLLYMETMYGRLQLPIRRSCTLCMQALWLHHDWAPRLTSYLELVHLT